jgi:hypothetical protein
LGWGGCVDDGGREDGEGFAVLDALTGPTQPFALVDALDIEPFNALGPVGGATPVKPGFGLYGAGGAPPAKGKFVMARGARGADFGTGRLVVGLVGE